MGDTHRSGLAVRTRTTGHARTLPVLPHSRADAILTTTGTDPHLTCDHPNDAKTRELCTTLRPSRRGWNVYDESFAFRPTPPSRRPFPAQTRWSGWRVMALLPPSWRRSRCNSGCEKEGGPTRAHQVGCAPCPSPCRKRVCPTPSDTRSDRVCRRSVGPDRWNAQSGTPTRGRTPSPVPEQ